MPELPPIRCAILCTRTSHFPLSPRLPERHGGSSSTARAADQPQAEPPVPEAERVAVLGVEALVVRPELTPVSGGKTVAEGNRSGVRWRLQILGLCTPRCCVVC